MLSTKRKFTCSFVLARISDFDQNKRTAMEIIRINDLHDCRLEMYTKLNEVQLKHYYEPDGGVFVAETELVISRALTAGCKPISFLVEEKSFDGEYRAA